MKPTFAIRHFLTAFFVSSVPLHAATIHFDLTTDNSSDITLEAGDNSFSFTGFEVDYLIVGCGGSGGGVNYNRAGGGAGGVGSDGSEAGGGGLGGLGLASSITGNSIGYARGGDGGIRPWGSEPQHAPGVDGAANTGNGGSGGASRSTSNDNNSYNNGSNGGSGIVVVRYSGLQVLTGGLVSTVGSDAVHQFVVTDSGSGATSQSFTMGFHAAVAGNIDGAGDLDWYGRGTPTLTGINTYTGSTTVNFGQNSAMCVSRPMSLPMPTPSQTRMETASSISSNMPSAAIRSRPAPPTCRPPASPPRRTKCRCTIPKRIGGHYQTSAQVGEHPHLVQPPSGRQRRSAHRPLLHGNRRHG